MTTPIPVDMPQSTVFIRKVNLVEQPAQVQQVHRTLEVNFNTRVKNQLNELVDSSTGINPLNSKKVANNLITYSAPMANVPIANGWQERRFSVFIEVELDTPFGRFKELITGYTDYVGATKNGALDPNMVITPSSCIQMKMYKKAGDTNSTMVIKNNVDILGKVTTEEPSYAMRPCDAISMKTVVDNYTELSTRNVKDMRSTIFNSNQLSRKSNNLRGNYFAKAYNALEQADHYLDTVWDDWGDNIANDGSKNYSVAAETITEISIRELLFLTKIKAARRPSAELLDNSFNLGELYGFRPDRNDRCYEVFFMDNTVVGNLNDTVNQISQNTQEAMLTVIISNSLPFFLTQFSVAKYSCTIFKRKSVDGSMSVMTDVVTTGITPIYSDLGSRNVKALEDTIRLEIMDNQILVDADEFYIEMSCDLFGNTTTQISLNGERLEPFSVPNYCSNIVNPLISPGIDPIANLTSGIVGSIEYCSNRYQRVDQLETAKTQLNNLA